MSSQSVKHDNLVRTIGVQRASGEFINLTLSETASASFSLNDLSAVIVTVTVESTLDLRLFGNSFISFFEGSVSGSNLIFGGTNIGVSDYIITYWYDLDLNDGKNIVYKAFIYNNSGSSQTIHVRVNHRLIVEEVS